MNAFKSFSIAVVLLLLQLYTSSVQAEESFYEEISYEDLVERLSAKKKNYVPASEDPFQTVKIHAGIGFVNSFSYFRINDQTFNRHQNGIQLAIGMDLFSPQWFAETAFRNYGLTETGSEEWTLREFDIRLGFKEQISHPWGYSLHAGLANRFFDLRDRNKNISTSAQTPSMLVGLGVYAQVHSQLSIGFDVNGKNALIGNTEDKGSLDLTFKVSASM